MVTKPAMLGLALSACLGLAGCSGGGGFGGGLFSGNADRAETVAVLGGDVVLAAPPGFCEDPSATRKERATAFVLFGSCKAITGAGRRPAAPAILTAAVSRSAGSLSASEFGQLAAYLETDEGRSALSRSRESAGVEVETILQSGDLILVRARDGGDQAMDPGFWRAIFPQSGALVTLTVSSLAESPVPAATGQALATDFVAAIKAVNAGEAVEVAPPQTAPEASPMQPERDPETVGTKPGALRAFFERLL